MFCTYIYDSFSVSINYLDYGGLSCPVEVFLYSSMILKLLNESDSLYVRVQNPDSQIFIIISSSGTKQHITQSLHVNVG